MKIGIYTFWRSNYGAILQAYSLQRVIKEISPDDEIFMVNFKTKEHFDLENVFSSRSNNKIKNLVWQIFVLFRYRQHKRKIDSFIEFQNQEFLLTREYNTEECLLKNPPQVDIHLSGSDQVFNPNGRYKNVYYLNFAKKESRKIAYAPSFGIHEFTNEQKTWIKESLKDFDTITCRESDGANFLSSLMDRNVPQVMDPVFLTSQTQWRNMERPYKIDRKYIFIYCLNSKAVLFLLNFAKKLIKNKDSLNIILLSPNYLLPCFGCRQIYDAGPREFVGLIDGAEYVITDSFHGTAFSIIFQKQFYTYISRPQVSSRIVSLLSSLSLLDRLISTTDKFHKDVKNKEYNQCNIEERLMESRRKLTEMLQI